MTYESKAKLREENDRLKSQLAEANRRLRLAAQVHGYAEVLRYAFFSGNTWFQDHAVDAYVRDLETVQRFRAYEAEKAREKANRKAARDLSEKFKGVQP